MPLTLAQMLALLPDNTAGDISAADMRDVATGLWRAADPASTPGDDADGVNWDGNDVAAGTTVTVTGSQTITEGDGLVSVKFNSQSNNDVNAVLSAKTISTGDKWRGAVRLFARDEQYSIAGILLTDGTTSTSNAVFASIVSSDVTNPVRLQLRHGTLTNMATSPIDISDFGLIRFIPWLVFEIEYVASNSFTVRFGDGLSFTNWGASAASVTMTPTHVGIGWTKFGGTEEAIATYGPLIKV